MSILIKGMEMPESCGMCDSQGLKNAVWHFGYGCSGDIDDFANCPPARCPIIPLTEKYGRLIDADELMLRVNMHGTNKFGMLDEDIRQFIDDAPTVIEAEEGELSE